MLAIYLVGAWIGFEVIANVVLLGVLAESVDIPEEVWEATLQERVPAWPLTLNQQAFAAGHASDRR